MPAPHEKQLKLKVSPLTTLAGKPDKWKSPADLRFTVRSIELRGGRGPQWWQFVALGAMRMLLNALKIDARVRLAEEGRYWIGESQVSTTSIVELAPGEHRDYALPIKMLFGREEIVDHLRASLHRCPN